MHKVIFLFCDSQKVGALYEEKFNCSTVEVPLFFFILICYGVMKLEIAVLNQAIIQSIMLRCTMDLN